MKASAKDRRAMFQSGKLLPGLQCDHCATTAVAMVCVDSVESVKVLCADGYREHRAQIRADWQRDRAQIMARLGL